jgi:hypothetical protein
VGLIYETALAFAREDGRLRAPMDMVAAARVQADSGDLAGAIASYEAAVEASVRSPAPPIGANLAGRVTRVRAGYAPADDGRPVCGPSTRVTFAPMPASALLAGTAEVTEEARAPHLASEVLIAWLSAPEVIQR